MDYSSSDKAALEEIGEFARQAKLDVEGGRVRRTSSRFCLGVEHGDYNGTELFGVGTDRFIWFAYKPNDTDRIRLFSGNYPGEGIVDFASGHVPPRESEEIAETWGRFPFGVDYVLRQEGLKPARGFDGVIWGNIPGGGMSRSASLTLNLILSVLDVNEIDLSDKFKIVELAQAVENVYIGSPCGQLDQIMILFARAGCGTHYDPGTRTIDYVPWGGKADGVNLVVMDTGTDRPGLEKSTYAIRRKECEHFVALLKGAGYDISCLADVKDPALCEKIVNEFQDSEPDLCARLDYIFHAQQRFYKMLSAWKDGDVETVGGMFRADGVGLRDDYRISGNELETMCDIARTVPGVLGERMLGGGDKGAAGALVRPESVDDLKQAIDVAYPRSHPNCGGRYAVHVCRIVEGVKVFDGL